MKIEQTFSLQCDHNIIVPSAYGGICIHCASRNCSSLKTKFVVLKESDKYLSELNLGEMLVEVRRRLENRTLEALDAIDAHKYVGENYIEDMTAHKEKEEPSLH